MKAARAPALDALRGIAALLVLTFHCWKIGVLGDWVGIHWTPLNLMVSGRPWVILFFVLSGFVLGLSLEPVARPLAPPAWRGFALRRVARVWLPFAASIGLSALLYWVVRPVPLAGLSLWFNGLGWSAPPDAALVAAHLLMTGREGEDSLNPVMWSLVHELRISLVFPLLAVACWRWPAAALGLAGAAFLGAGWALGCRDGQCQPFRGESFAASLLVTLYFVVFFVLGILLARHRLRLVGVLRTLPGPVVALFGLGAVLAMALPSIPRLMRFVPADPCYGLGAAALILLAISGGAWQRALEHPALRWCGRVSYSLYLTHNIVLLAVVQLLHGELAPVPLVLAVIAASLVVAGGFHALVEVPAILLGRRIGAGPRPALVVAR